MWDTPRPGEMSSAKDMIDSVKPASLITWKGNSRAVQPLGTSKNLWNCSRVRGRGEKVATLRKKIMFLLLSRLSAPASAFNNFFQSLVHPIIDLKGIAVSFASAPPQGQGDSSHPLFCLQQQKCRSGNHHPPSVHVIYSLHCHLPDFQVKRWVKSREQEKTVYCSGSRSCEEAKNTVADLLKKRGRTAEVLWTWGRLVQG